MTGIELSKSTTDVLALVTKQEGRAAYRSGLFCFATITVR
jgi:hypothetical protein